MSTMLGSYSSGPAGGKRRRAAAKVKASEQFAPEKEELIRTDEGLARFRREDEDIGGYLEECVRHLWRAVEENRVLLGFAAVGYDSEAGWPVYDHDVLVDLLINYGYTVDVAMLFSGELARSKWKDGTRRVVINSSHRVDIYSHVKKLPDNPCS